MPREQEKQEGRHNRKSALLIQLGHSLWQKKKWPNWGSESSGFILTHLLTQRQGNRKVIFPVCQDTDEKKKKPHSDIGFAILLVNYY